MTENYNKNRQNYLDLCNKVWNLDDESMKYLEKRLSDDWEPVPEFKTLIDALKEKGATYEDQRVMIDIDMSNTDIQSIFVSSDLSYKIFENYFSRLINYLQDHYNCTIGYKEFIENKVVFKKNITKIKKVFEVVCAEENSLFERSSGDDYTKERCANWIVRCFEEIGASKKSAKKLQFVISFNPMDWLLSSTGESWSSCFNINNAAGGYQYCLGLPFLAGDKNRMLLYITDGSTKESCGIEAHHYQTRTWCLLDRSGSFNIVKWYPNDTIGVKPVNSITGYNNFKDRDCFTHSRYPIDVLSTRKGAVIGVYSDMGRLVEENNELWISGNGKEGQQIFTKNLIDVQYSSTRNSFHISDSINLRSFGISQPGYRIPEWKNLGLHVDMIFQSMKCDCGADNKGGFMFKSKKFLCYDCYKNKVYTCGSCGSEDFINGEVHEIETTTGKKIKLCQECWDNREEKTCHCCGKYSINSLKNTDESGVFICKECADSHKNGWSKCDGCGKFTRHVKIKYNTYTKSSLRRCGACISENNVQEISTFGRYFGIITRAPVRGNIIE